jgi:hypothetical protein
MNPLAKKCVTAFAVICFLGSTEVVFRPMPLAVADIPYCTGWCEPGFWQGYQLIDYCSGLGYDFDLQVGICGDLLGGNPCQLEPSYDYYESGGCSGDLEPANEECVMVEYVAQAHTYDGLCNSFSPASEDYECGCVIEIISTDPVDYSTCYSAACTH